MNLYLIDGNSYFYRAYHAIRGLTNSRGFPTNAIYGFTNMILKIIREKRPDAIAIAFDSSLPTERHKIYEEYKAQRPKAPSDLIVQIPHIKEIIKAFNIVTLEVPGYEADDIICTIAKRAALQHMSVFILSGDKDMMQVVGNGIRIYDPMRDLIIDENHVSERFGVPPERLPEVMAITGDAVDNIPGVKGIGEKTARELLSMVGSLDELLNHPEKIESERIRKMIVDNIENIKISKALATINTNIPIDVNIQEMAIKEPDWPSLLSLFSRFEFKSLIKMIPPAGYGPRGQYRTITDKDELIKALPVAPLSFDIEATGRDPISDSVVGIALCREKGKAYYVPIRHKHGTNIPDALNILKGVLEDTAIPKIGHNLKYDILILRQEGIHVKGKLYDTMLASYLLNPNRQEHNLEDVALEYLLHKKRLFTEILGGLPSFSEVPIDEATQYAAEDAELAMELKDILFGRLKTEGLEDLYFDIEMPLIYVLADMEEAGVRINRERLEELSKELERELGIIESRIYNLAGEGFNINSPQQLQKILFGKLGLKPLKKTKTGYSTGMDVLEELSKTHELPMEILNYRTLYKLKTTYVDALPKLINKKTGRIHTSFNQTVTATGRLSSSEPNLQNIPIRGEWGTKIREVFIPDDRCVFISADYSQVELRILAHISGDEGLTNAFNRDIDIHTRTASELFNIPKESVTEEIRRIAKTVNFGVIYGISPFGLSESLDITPKEAATYIEQYFRRHDGVKNYIDNTIKAARENGYVKTLLGRKRPIPEINSNNTNTRQQAERLAINTPIQGTAADLIKIAMRNIWRRIKEEGLRTRMILQIHDELLFEVPEPEIEIAKDLIQYEMENALPLSVPLRVDIGWGKNWAEAQ